MYKVIKLKSNHYESNHDLHATIMRLYLNKVYPYIDRGIDNERYYENST